MGASAHLDDNYRLAANQLFVLQERAEGVVADVHGYSEDIDEEESQVRAVSPSNCSAFLVVLGLSLPHTLTWKFKLKCTNFRLATETDTVWPSDSYRTFDGRDRKGRNGRAKVVLPSPGRRLDVHDKELILSLRGPCLR